MSDELNTVMEHFSINRYEYYPETGDDQNESLQDAIPQLLSDGRTMLTTREIVQKKLESTLALLSAKPQTIPTKELRVHLEWLHSSMLGCDGIYFDSKNRVKVVVNDPRIRAVNQKTLYLDGVDQKIRSYDGYLCLGKNIDEGIAVYEATIGEELSPKDLERMSVIGGTFCQPLKNPLWNALLQHDTTLIKEYEKLMRTCGLEFSVLGPRFAVGLAKRDFYEEPPMPFCAPTEISSFREKRFATKSGETIPVGINLTLSGIAGCNIGVIGELRPWEKYQRLINQLKTGGTR